MKLKIIACASLYEIGCYWETKNKLAVLIKEKGEPNGFFLFSADIGNA